MASVQKLKANATKDTVWEAVGSLSSTGSVMDISTVSGATNFAAFPGTGNGGVTIGSMTLSPETNPESGYLTITVGGTSYQIPIYAE